MKENYEECVDWRNSLLSFLLGVLLGLAAIGLLFGISFVSASPYQLNLSTGELIDLGVGNDTANITIYILNYSSQTILNNSYPNNTFQNVSNNITWYNYTNISQNVTWTNITNITNVTCVNCTQNYTNITDLRMYNYTYQLNGTTMNTSFYNQTQIDEKIALLTSSQNSLATAVGNDLNSLATTITAVNSSIDGSGTGKKNSDTALWIVIGLIGVISLFAILRAGNGGSE
jgi:hypothetical protein